MVTWAATAMAVMKTPSTPKGVKKVCRLRVSLKGTGSLRSNTPLHTIIMLQKRQTNRQTIKNKERKEETLSGNATQGRWRCSYLLKHASRVGVALVVMLGKVTWSAMPSQRLVACHSKNKETSLEAARDDGSGEKGKRV